MGPGMFDGLAVFEMFALCCIPFGVWKIIEIIIWLISHIRII
jgi:uncharacterized membrane protein